MTRLTRILPSGDPERLAALVVRALSAGHPRVMHPFPYSLVGRFPVLAAAITSRLSPRPRP